MADTNAVPLPDKQRPPTKILIVEDEAIVAMDLASQLHQIGFEICGIVDNGQAALEEARAKQPDLILMDIVLKGKMDGIEVAYRIGRSMHIPVVFLTAYSDSETVERAVQASPYGYITKPFQVKGLRASIQVALYKATLQRQLRNSEQWFASMLRCVADSVIATDNQGRISFMNLSAEALLGWTFDEAIGRQVDEIMPLENKHSATPLESPIRRALNCGHSVGIDFGAILITRDGSKLSIDDSAAPIWSDDGNLLGAICAFHEVQDRIHAEERLRQSEERFRNAFDFAPLGMALVSLDNRFLQVNGAVCTLLGYTPAELLGNDQSHFSHAEESEREHALLYQILAGELASVQFEKRYLAKGNRDVSTLVSASLLREKDAPLCYLFQVHDLTDQKKAESQLARLAHFDPLTGLANRARLSDELGRQIHLAQRHHWQLGVVFIDLDHFKQINDSLGHEAGDELLQIIAGRLESSVRQTDTVARLGGDEFVILLSELHNAQEVALVTDKLRAECTKPLSLAGREIIMTISLGISLFPDDAEDGRTLLRYADSALYEAKNKGRNNMQFYRPELMARLEHHLKLRADLQVALDHNEFELYFQPIVTLGDGALLGAEALIRWNHPALGLLHPDSFIPLAEETGLIVPIGEWVIRNACREAACWPNNNLMVAVNVSARQFDAGDLLDIIKRETMASGLGFSRLCIEVTEQLLLRDSERNLAIIAGLREMGVQIAIDDFGTGYSSLSYLHHFSPTEIKIDRSLVHNVTVNSGSAAIVRAVIAMARSLKLRLIIEGVETKAQQALLHMEGCEAAQGYFFSRPVPAPEFRLRVSETGSNPIPISGRH